MKAAIPEPRTDAFAWDAEQRLPLVLGGFLVLSLVAHAAAFFIFQVTYPQRATIPPPAPQITILDPAIPEHAAMLAWVAAEDPGLSAAISRANPPGLATVKYKASFDLMRSWPHSAPRTTDPVPLPPGMSGLPFIEMASTAEPPPVSVPPPIPTSLTVSGPLAARPLLGPFEPRITSTAAVSPLDFLVGVSADGNVRYRLLHRSSGEDAVDDAVALAIRDLSFAPSSGDMTWGMITVTLGDDTLVTANPQQSRNSGKR